jgi:hypothetical protein
MPRPIKFHRPSGPDYWRWKKKQRPRLDKMGNRLPVGPGSRGGHWHEVEFRRAYFQKWRREHPEYRERERQRRLLKHMEERTRRVVEGGTYERPRTPDEEPGPS